MKTKILSFFFISVFQQYHRTKIWISSHQKCSFELENNILALNMIDITVMSSQTQNQSVDANLHWAHFHKCLVIACHACVCFVWWWNWNVYWLFFWHFDAQIKTIFKLENFTLEFLCKWIINWANTINKYITVCWLNLRGSQERLRQDKKRHVCFENNFDWLNKMARNLDFEF